MDKPRDLFDQMLQNLAGKYLPGYRMGAEGMQWSVHPLPRRGLEVELVERQVSPASPIAMAPTTANSNNDDNGDDGTTAPAAAAPVGQTGAGASNAIPASILAAAASPSQTQASSGDATSGTASPSAASAASATASPARSPPSSAASPSSSPPSTPASASSASASATPNSKTVSSNASNSSSSSSPSSSTPTSSSTSSTSATPTSQKQQSDSQETSPPLLSPKNHLFPLVIAGIAAGGLLGIMLLIAIARAIAHDQLRRDNLKKSYAFDDPLNPSCSKKGGSSDRFTSAAPGMSAARSLRRAITKKKLGSFARRTQEGSVLIEVGDEVFAVPQHLADSYREKIVREGRLRSASKEDLFGGVKPKFLSDGGPDGDPEVARLAYDSMLDGKKEGAPVRSLSQRLADRFRTLTTTAAGAGVGAMPVLAETKTPMVERNAYSFSTQNQTTGAIRQANLATSKPVLTQGSTEWSIQQRPGPHPIVSRPPETRAKPTTARTTTDPAQFGTGKITQRSSSIKAPQRKPPPKLELTLLTEKLADLEKRTASSHSSAASSSRGARLPKEASLSSADSANGTFGGSQTSADAGSPPTATLPGAFPERTKSLHHTTGRVRSIKPLILDANTPNSESARPVGGYRHRQADSAHRSKTTLHSRTDERGEHAVVRKSTVVGSVGLASPTRFTHETSGRVVVHPARPEAAAAGVGFRPLPVPPPFNLPK